jgi:hypothetical protein
VHIDRAASDPFTTREVLAEMHETPLRGTVEKPVRVFKAQKKIAEFSKIRL